jgi:hypothetical protein
MMEALEMRISGGNAMLEVKIDYPQELWGQKEVSFPRRKTYLPAEMLSLSSGIEGSQINLYMHIYWVLFHLFYKL